MPYTFLPQGSAAWPSPVPRGSRGRPLSRAPRISWHPRMAPLRCCSVDQLMVPVETVGEVQVPPAATSGLPCA